MLVDSGALFGSETSFWQRQGSLEVNQVHQGCRRSLRIGASAGGRSGGAEPWWGRRGYLTDF